MGSIMRQKERMQARIRKKQEKEREDRLVGLRRTEERRDRRGVCAWGCRGQREEGVQG